MSEATSGAVLELSRISLRSCGLLGRLQRRDGFPDQAFHRDVVVMRRIGPAEFDDHEVMRGDDDRVLALAADRHKTVGREAGGNALADGGGVAALGPESRAVAVFVGA